MSKENIQISQIEGEEIPYDLLLLSDDTIEAIDKNLDGGKLFTAKIEDRVEAAFILKIVEPDTIEIKNIAVSETKQGKGIGTVLLNFIISKSIEENLKKLIVGTCDLCSKEIAFYQKSGFKITGVKTNFFIENYDKPIYENGEQIKDMVMLSMDLQKEKESRKF
nr:GNAT family N-acetyltransferase [uncultured Fluviicola sp.]